ncbi:MAG: hypothetical protein EA402_13185 [Planctomycetota bacterium]|nr:MAG: hypothetical protein EA402_13185 [Planctomycetota bacterium]
MTTPLIGAGGEEWLAMDETTGYNPQAEADTIHGAAAAIPQIRQRDVSLHLVDRAGKPLAHTAVEIEQTESAFLWGHNLWGLDRAVREGRQNRDDVRTECRLMSQLLNAMNALHYWTERPRNDGPKSEDQQGYPTYEHLQWCVDWANSEGLMVKGHPLFWTVPKAVPDWVQAYDSYETRMAFLEVRIRSIVKRFKGKIRIYDAVNEPMWEPAFKDLPKRTWPQMTPIADIADYIEPVLRWAREEDPDACYLINEYGVCLDDHKPCGMPGSDGSKVTPHSQFMRYLDLLDELDRRGAAPDAVGLQGHTGGWGHHDRDMATYGMIQERCGLPVHITEFWAHTKHLEKAGMPADEIQARQWEYVRNCVTCAFGSPAVEAFFFWGMSKDLFSIFGNGGIEAKPLYGHLKRLLHEEWRTRLSATTDGDGCLRFRGFHGDYALRVKQGGSGQRSGFTFSLPLGADPFVHSLRLPHR